MIQVKGCSFELRHSFASPDVVKVFKAVANAEDPFVYVCELVGFDGALQMAPVNHSQRDAQFRAAFMSGHPANELVRFYRDKERVRCYAFLLEYTQHLARDRRPRLEVPVDLALSFLPRGDAKVPMLVYTLSFLRTFELPDDARAARCAFVMASRYHAYWRGDRDVKSVGRGPLTTREKLPTRPLAWEHCDGACAFFDCLMEYGTYMGCHYSGEDGNERAAWDACITLKKSKRKATPIFDHMLEWAKENGRSSDALARFTQSEAASRFGQHLSYLYLVRQCACERDDPKVLCLLRYKADELAIEREDDAMPYFAKDSDYARYMLNKRRKTKGDGAE